MRSAEVPPGGSGGLGGLADGVLDCGEGGHDIAADGEHAVEAGEFEEVGDVGGGVDEGDAAAIGLGLEVGEEADEDGDAGGVHGGDVLEVEDEIARAAAVDSFEEVTEAARHFMTRKDGRGEGDDGGILEEFDLTEFSERGCRDARHDPTLRRKCRPCGRRSKSRETRAGRARLYRFSGARYAPAESSSAGSARKDSAAQ